MVVILTAAASAVVAVAAASTWPHYDSPAINCCLAGDVIILRPSRSVLQKYQMLK